MTPHPFVCRLCEKEGKGARRKFDGLNSLTWGMTGYAHLKCAKAYFDRLWSLPEDEQRRVIVATAARIEAR